MAGVFSQHHPFLLSPMSRNWQAFAQIRKVGGLRRKWLFCLMLAMFLVSACSISKEANSARHVRRGMQFATQGDYGRALLEFRTASELTPKDPEIYYQVGLVQLKNGNPVPAVEAFRKTLALNPKHAGAQVQLAQLMVATNEKALWTEAEKKAESAIAESPAAEAFNVLALSELRLGRVADAVGHLQEAIRRFPDNLKVVANLAEIKLAQRDTSGAEEALKNAVTQMPKSPKPLVALGRFYLITRNPGEAEKQFQRAIQIDPKYAPAVLDLAQLQDLAGRTADAEQTLRRTSSLSESKYRILHPVYLFQMGRHQDAIQEFEAMAKRDPKDREVRTKLVTAYTQTGRIGDAERVLASALKNNPKDLEALVQRAAIAAFRQNYTEAESNARKALQLEPNSAGSHYVLSLVHEANGRESSRRQELAEVLRLRPGMIEARIELAQSLISSNNPNEALKVLGEAPTAEQNLIPMLVQRNWALALLQRWSDLRKEIDRGLGLAPRSPDLLLQDGILRTQQKDYAGARKSLGVALKESPGDIRIVKALAGTHVAEQQVANAVQVVREYAEQNRNSATAQLLYGRWLLAQGSPRQAESAFALAKAADPKSVDADLALAQAQFSAGSSDQARRTIEQALTSKGEDARLRLLLASMDEAAGDRAEAIVNYQKCVALAPQNVVALTNLAYLTSFDKSTKAQSLGYAQKAIELAPSDPTVKDTLGWVHFSDGNFKAALTYFQGAAADGRSARAQYHLSMAYAMIGERSLAIQAYSKAHKLDPASPEDSMARAALSR